MKPELHTDAAKNFNAKARALLDKVAPPTEAMQPGVPTHFVRPEGHAHVIGEGEPGSFRITGMQDQLTGRTTARHFELRGGRLGFEGEPYQELARLSEALQKTNQLREIVSAEWVEDRILEWAKEQLAGDDTEELVDFIAERCEEDVKEHELWFPVAQLSLESDLAFGNVVFKTISEQMLVRVEEEAQLAKEGRSKEEAAQIDFQVNRMRHELQGLAAATISVTAEPKRADEVGRRESERAVELLRIFDTGATMMPEVVSYCALLGRENIEQLRLLGVEGGRMRRETRKVIGNPILNFHLSDEDISRYKRIFGFDGAGELLALERRTEFQEKLLDALLLYSRSTREKDLAGRLVYMLVAIETMLLRNENEPIQQNIGDRMAFAGTRKVKRLRELRLGANMTQKELAESAELDQATVSRLENSDRHPHPNTLLKLAYALGVVPEKLDPDLAEPYQPRPTRQMPNKVAKPLLSLAEALARRYARWNGERADLSSAGQEGLWEAWSKFDPDRGVPFEKFAGPRIKWRVLDKARQLHRAPKVYGTTAAPPWVREYMTGFGSTDIEKSQED